jgi:hypothetical protein
MEPAERAVGGGSLGSVERQASILNGHDYAKQQLDDPMTEAPQPPLGGDDSPIRLPVVIGRLSDASTGI